MSERILIKNGKIINDGKKIEADILIIPPFIEKIEKDLSDPSARVINAEGHFVIPGVIDDHVHFREPGLTHKGDIFSESRSAVAGGVTSYMDMPNVIPRTLSQDLLEEKFRMASTRSWANYSFYMGVSNENNLSEVFKTDPSSVCGIKAFLGGAHGELLLENESIVEKLFSETPVLIATHCEQEEIINKNTEEFKKKYNEDIPVSLHPEIRNEEACYQSSLRTVELAKRKKARLHILHLSTARELSLFQNDISVEDKLITCEVCVHHLWFDDKDYAEKGNFIKWNPAIKSSLDKDQLLKGLLNDKIDNIATDHAPHTLEEKNNSYLKSPSGAPMIQHSLAVMMEFYRMGKISLEKIVEKMCHNPAKMFHIDRRGYLTEGYFADIAIINPDNRWEVNKDNILYKCGWSPLAGQEFGSRVSHTIVSGNLVYEDGKFPEFTPGLRLVFNR